MKHLFLFIFFAIFSASTSANDNAKKWIIVIDAGHGGRDHGAIGSSYSEKDITLAIALKTGDYLKKYLSNVTIIYTREKDTFIALYERARIANKNKADLFISIHANSTSSKNSKGTETFVMGLTKEKENLEVAMKENEAIYFEKDYSSKYEGFDPKSPESFIIFTLTQNIFQTQSVDLASKIQTQYKQKVGRVDRGVKQAGFWVLFKTSMPSILTETGFISNPEEERFLNSKQGQDYLSSAIFRACRDYIIEIDSRSGLDKIN